MTEHAKRVNLMRLKASAIGNKSIPVDKRYYLEVIFPLEGNVQPKLMFFDSSWAVGRVLDLIAAEGKIPNNNDKPGSTRLYLISLKTGFPLDNSLLLKELGSNVLQSGDGILLEKLVTGQLEKP